MKKSILYICFFFVLSFMTFGNERNIENAEAQDVELNAQYWPWPTPVSLVYMNKKYPSHDIITTLMTLGDFHYSARVIDVAAAWMITLDNADKENAKLELVKIKGEEVNDEIERQQISLPEDISQGVELAWKKVLCRTSVPTEDYRLRYGNEFLFSTFEQGLGFLSGAVCMYPEDESQSSALVDISVYLWALFYAKNDEDKEYLENEIQLRLNLVLSERTEESQRSQTQNIEIDQQ